MAQILHSLSYKGMFYHTVKVQYIWIVYCASGYIRYYGPDSLLLQCDDIRNRSIKTILILVKGITAANFTLIPET